MLKLNLAGGGRIEVPGYAIIAIMKPGGDTANPSSLLYDMGEGPRVDQLGDQYGFVKKLAIDSGFIVNGFEADIVECGSREEEGKPVPVINYGKIFTSREKIVARRDIPNSVDAKARIYVAAGGGSIGFDVTQSLDEMDGIDPADVKQKAAEDGPGDQPPLSPAPAPTKPRRRGNTKDNTDGND